MLPLFNVGASLLAMDVNDNAFFLNKRVALKSIASKLAPTSNKGKCAPAHSVCRQFAIYSAI
ncbi:hypothetical protein EMIT0P253_10182 [Pseudomonas sp. IT-P253]